MSFDFGTFLLTMLASPVLYAGLLGTLLAMYTVWRLCRQSYLLPEKQFNVLWLAWLCGYVAMVVAAWLRLGWNQGGWLTTEQWLQGLLPLTNWEIWQSASLILAGYAAAAGVAVWYIRSIRYPLWKMLDMAAVGLMVGQVCLMIGWLVRWDNWPTAQDWLMLGWAMVLLGLLLWLYRRYSSGKREGLVAAIQVMGIFAWLVVAQVLDLAWHGQIGVVELIAATAGLLVGLGLLGYRLWQPSTVIRLQDTPSGVSQSFKETFSRLGMGNQTVTADKPQVSAPVDSLAPEATTGLKNGVVVVNQEEFAPPVDKPVKKLLKKRSSRSGAKKEIKPD